MISRFGGTILLTPIMVYTYCMDAVPEGRKVGNYRSSHGSAASASQARLAIRPVDCTIWVPLTGSTVRAGRPAPAGTIRRHPFSAEDHPRRLAGPPSGGAFAPATASRASGATARKARFHRRCDHRGRQRPAELGNADVRRPGRSAGTRLRRQSLQPGQGCPDVRRSLIGQAETPAVASTLAGRRRPGLFSGTMGLKPLTSADSQPRRRYSHVCQGPAHCRL
jgi:hypothetical protein